MNPRLRIKTLRLFVLTSRGEVSRKIDFKSGLNILRADNTSGKTTALQGIIYALGLEGMLGPSQRIPLTYAMTERVNVNGEDSAVIQSWVELQITNASNQTITVSRPVVDKTKDIHLVTVTQPHSNNTRKVDYFVRRAGAAQNLAGFHRFLADFLGLSLPRVNRMDGSEGLLYLETLFPYFFVEQKHGWSGIQTRMPTYLGIRDVSKRSTEFLLGLEAFDRIVKSQRIRSKITDLEIEWQSLAKQISEVSKISRVVIRNYPQKIRDGVQEDSFIPTVSIENEWLPLGNAIAKLQVEIDTVSNTIPSSAEASVEVEQDLRQLDASLRQSLGILSALEEERNEHERQYHQVSLRLDALREDLQRHKDTQTLERFGSEHAHALIAEHVCPTCRQHLDDGAEISDFTMTASESIGFINQQITIFQSSAADLERVIKAIEIRQQSLTTQISEYRREIRAARETLTAANSSPSIADISRRLTLQARVDQLISIREQLSDFKSSLSHLSTQWKEQKLLLKEFESAEFSSRDLSIISELERSIRSQLGSYGFRSLKPSEIDIDQSTFRPSYEGFDLGFNLSASDMIRVIWAYLFAMLDVGSKNGNHLGLLIFDEPRQQDTARESYQALLSHASSRINNDVQIIFATSEPSENLVAMLEGHPFNLIDLKPGEKLLREP